MGKSKGPFGGSSHCSASAEAVWAVWTNPAAWSGGVIATAKIDGPFAVGARITTRVKGYPPLTSTVTPIVSMIFPSSSLMQRPRIMTQRTFPYGRRSRCSLSNFP